MVIRFLGVNSTTTLFMLIGGVNSSIILHTKSVFVLSLVAWRTIMTVTGKLFVDVMVAWSTYGPSRKAAVVVVEEPAAV